MLCPTRFWQKNERGALKRMTIPLVGGSRMTVLELKAQQDALQKIATTRDPVRALAEVVWNAIDADATHVSVAFDRNALGGLDSIAISDDGTGISRERALAGACGFREPWGIVEAYAAAYRLERRSARQRRPRSSPLSFPWRGALSGGAFSRRKAASGKSTLRSSLARFINRK